jgi:hypothetical protein
MSRRDSAQKITAAVFLAAFFLAFTWRGIFVYFSGDDVSNLYFAWKPPLAEIVQANLFFWSHHYRPFGGAVYRTMFGIFGFHPRPFAILYYAALLFNLWLAYAVFQRLAHSDEVARLATLVFAVHGCLSYLYNNIGVLYDVFCFTFFFSMLLVYLRIRDRGEYPGWREFAILLVLFICCLNSKEVGAALPPILLLYEATFHWPREWRLRTLSRWLTHEARTALILLLLLIPYAVGKLSPQGLASSAAYVPHVSAHAWLESTAQYLAYLVYSPRPLAASEAFLFYGVLSALAVATRSRLLCFGLLFFVITLLPVSFVSVRLGFVLYLPLAGLALYAAALLAGIKNQAATHLPAFVGTLLFLVTAAGLAVVHARHWRTPRESSPVRITARQFRSRLPDVRPGTELLFVKDAFGGSYELLYTLSLLYNEKELEVAQLEGRSAQEAAADLDAKYDHIFTYEGGRYREMDHSNTARSVRLHMLLDEKTGQPAGGEMLVVGREDQDAFYVADVLTGEPHAEAYWTLDAPQLKFALKPSVAYAYRVRFYLPGQTFEKTGPVTIRFYINDRLLDQVRYNLPGQQIFREPVPPKWIPSNGFTVVKMEVANPYIAPADGAKLGFLLQSAGFESAK